MVFGQDGSFTSAAPNDGTLIGDVAGLGPDSLFNPQGLAIDSAGNLYIVDNGNNRVLEYNTPLNALSGETGAGDATADLVFGQSGSFTLAQCDGSDSGELSGFGVTVNPATLCSPAHAAVDATGNLYVTDSSNERMLVYNTPLNASSGETGAGDTTADRELGQTDLDHNMDNFGGAAALQLANPASTLTLAAMPAIDSNDHIYVADTVNSRVLGWSSASAFANGDPATIVIGQNDFFSFGCTDGVAAGDVGGVGPDSLCAPGGAAVDSAGNLYVADTGDNRVLEFTQPFLSGKTSGLAAHMVFGQAGSFTTIASGAGADGLHTPTGVAVDATGDVFVADTGNSRVLEYDNPLAVGGGTPGTPGSAGDTTADMVFGQDGSFSTVACNGGTAGGDVGGVGPDSLCRPSGLALDASGNLYIDDYGNSRVTEYNTPLNPSSGETGAGDAIADLVFGQNGSFTANGCNKGKAAGDQAGVGADSLCLPAAVAADSAGDIYVADSGNNRVLEYDTPLNPGSGETGAGDTIADVVFGQAGSFTSTGCAVAAKASTLCSPNGLALDSSGNLYVADSSDSRLLAYNHFSATPTPTPSASPTPSATPSPSPTPTSTATATSTATPAASSTPTPSSTATPAATASPTSTPGATPSSAPTASPSPTPTPAPSSTATPTPTASSTPTPTPTPTAKPTPMPGGSLSVATAVFFGPTGIGVPPKVRFLPIFNVSTRKRLTVSLAPLRAPFALVSGTGPFVIRPGSKLAATISFNPTAVGPTTETLRIASSDPHHTSVGVALFGRGKTGAMALPAGVFFGKVGIGVGPATRTFDLVNTGIGILTGSVGALSVPFGVTSGGGAFTLPPGHKRLVTVQFTPTAPGPTPSLLTITSNDPNHPSVNLPIGGKGVGGHLVIDLPLPTLFAFGHVVQGTVLFKRFAITNSGLGMLSGSVGALSSPFSVTRGAGAFTLRPGQSTTVGVRFAPTVKGKATSTLTITIYSPSAPPSASLTVAGTGV
jgi:NHL repeat